MVKANAERPNPAVNISPKIVENQCGPSDITQSVIAKVSVRTRNSRPGALTVRKRTIPAGSVDSSPRSCAADHLVSTQLVRIQNAKKNTARPVKKGTFKYGAFNCRILSPATTSGRAHMKSVGIANR